MARRFKDSSSTNRFGGNFGHGGADRGHMSALVQMLIRCPVAFGKWRHYRCWQSKGAHELTAMIEMDQLSSSRKFKTLVLHCSIRSALWNGDRSEMGVDFWDPQIRTRT